jgi:hypothetical protein
MDRQGSPARRQAVFGQGLGLITFDVDDGVKLIRVFDIAWIGSRPTRELLLVPEMFPAHRAEVLTPGGR